MQQLTGCHHMNKEVLIDTEEGRDLGVTINGLLKL